MEAKAGLTAADMAAGVAAFAKTAADANMRSRRPRYHRQQQRHKRHAAELRINVGVICRRLQLRRKRPQGWELRGQHALGERVLFIGTQFSILYTSMYSRGKDRASFLEAIAHTMMGLKTRVVYK